MLKKFKDVKILIAIMIALLALIGATGVSLGWISKAINTVNQPVSEGSIRQNYFHCGSGTKDDPFVITRPIHYYHLTELYQRYPEFAAENYYFQLGYDLDGDGDLEFYEYDNNGVETESYSNTLNMASYSGTSALLPIGTSGVPFNGHFNGSGLTVANLHITGTETNVYGTFTTADVGIFGYVGAGATITNAYFEYVTLDLTGTTASNTGSGHNYGSGIHTTNSTQDTVNVGYIAGHIVKSSTCDDVYINHCTIKGGSTYIGQNGYGYFGCVEDGSGNASATLASEIIAEREKGGSSGFGSSIDMQAIYNRVSTILGNSSTGGISRTTTYPTAETIVAPSTSTGTPEVTVNSTASIGTSDYGTVYYWSSPMSGTYIGTHNSSWNYIYGLKSTQTTSVTTEDKTGTQVKAYYIKSGNNYLHHNDGTIAATTTMSTAAKWLIDKESHWYTYVGSTPYFLNVSGTTGITLSSATTNQTVWTQNTDGELYTTIGETAYYLVYQNGWTITARSDVYKIHVGDSYLISDSTTPVTETKATGWQVSNPEMSDTVSSTIYLVSGEVTHYLGYDGLNLTMSTTETVWYKDTNGYYCKIGDDKYYLTLENNVWKCTLLSYSCVSDGQGHYLSVSDGKVTNSDASAAAQWRISDATSGTWSMGTYNLVYSETDGLKLSSSDVATWIKEETNGKSYYYTTVNGINYYLTYDADGDYWYARPQTYYVIKDDAEVKYFSLNYNGTEFDNEITEEVGASKWYFTTNGDYPSGKMFTYVDGKPVYIGYNEGLAIGTQTEWATENGYIYVSPNGIKLYLVYYNHEWQVMDNIPYYYIYDNAGHYLNMTSSGITAVTGDDGPTRWVASAETSGGTLSATVTDASGNETKYYLVYSVNNGLSYSTSGTESSTTGTSWTKDGTSFYTTVNGVNYYLTYDETLGNWYACPATYYLIYDSDEKMYFALNADGTGFDNSVSSVANAGHWYFTTSAASPSGQMFTYVNGKPVYVGYNSGLKIGTQTSWSNESGHIYCTPSTTKLYLGYYQGAWTVMHAIPYYYISDGTHYLNMTEVGVSSTTTKSDATRWTASNGTSGGVLSVNIGGTNYYLIYSETEGLTCSTTDTSVNWTASGSAYYATVNGINYYLTYDSTLGNWYACPETYYLIKDSASGKYFTLSSATAVNNSVTTESAASKWYFTTNGTYPSGKMFTYVNGTPVYVGYNNGLSLGTQTQTSWSNDNGYIYYSSNGIRQYLVYNGSAWTVMSEIFYIKDSAGRYLNLTTSGVSYTTAESSATKWAISNGISGSSLGTLSSTIGSTLYYLNGTSELSSSTSSGQSFTLSGGNLDYSYGGNTYRLTYDSNITNFTVYNPSVSYYTLSYGAYYLSATTSAVTTETTKAAATKWNFSSDSGGYITTYKNGTLYYLYIQVGFGDLGSEVGISTDSDKASLTYSFSSTTSDSTSRISRSYSVWGTRYVRYDSGWTYSTSTRNATTITRTPYTYTAASITINSFTTTTETAKTNTKTAITIERKYDKYPSLSETSGDNTKTVTTIEKKIDKLPSLSEWKRTDTNTAITVENKTSTPANVVFTETKGKYPLEFTETTETEYGTATATYRRGSYFPLNVDSSSSVYAASSSNTGYIVGGTYSEKSGSGQGDVRISRYGVGNISGSYSRWSKTFSTIYTYNDSGRDEVSSSDYSEYDRVLSDFKTILSSSGNYIYGLHFMNTAVSTSHIITAEVVSLYGKNYVNYQLPESSIDFKVASRGYITVLAGDYYDGNNSFFSLNQITRDSTGKNITSIKEISEIYQHSTLGSKRSYIYKYSDGTYSGTLTDAYEKVFDMEWMTNPGSLSGSRIYYFQIPCNAGEYALGSVNGKDGGYLLYLDIATSSGQGAEKVVSYTGNDITNNFKVDYRTSPESLADGCYSVLQYSITAPAGASTENFEVTVDFTKNVGSNYDYSDGLYTITVKNYTGSDLTLEVYLCDDDKNEETDFLYAYEIKFINQTYSSAQTLESMTGDAYFQSMSEFTIPSSGYATETSW